MKIYCATGNQGKLSEFQAAAASFGFEDIEILPLPGLESIPAPEECGASFEENAIAKARYYGKHTNGYLFADDSGLEVEALGGEPGVRSARFAGPQANDEENNRLLLERLLRAQDRRARFVCVLALVREGELVRTFRGEVEGEILLEPRGNQGFGYDPLFWHPPSEACFGEIPRHRKMLLSHRGKALQAMLQHLRENIRSERV